MVANVRWAETGDKVEPPTEKKDAGFKSGYPESAQYINWYFDQVSGGVNLDRSRNLLVSMSLKNDLSMDRGVGTTTFARSTTATYIDRHGVVQAAAIDEARFEQAGFLVERATTNDILRSEEFDNASWTKTRATISANATNGPDGNATADKLLEDATASNSHLVSQNITDDATLDWAGSVFVKVAGRTAISIVVWDAGASSNNVSAIFDLATGTVYSSTIGGNGVLNAARIESLANGWYRCSVAGKPNTSGTTVGMAVYLRDALTAGGDIYNGDSSSGVFLWGAQLEQMPYATSYVVTATAGVTRATDTCELTIADNIVLQADAGAVVLTVHLPSVTTNWAQDAFTIKGETYRIIRTSNPGGTASVTWGHAGPTLTDTPTAGSTKRYGMAHNGSGGVSGWIDGTKVGSGSGFIVTDPLGSMIHLGSSTTLGVGVVDGHLRDLRIYDFSPLDKEMTFM